MNTRTALRLTALVFGLLILPAGWAQAQYSFGWTRPGNLAGGMPENQVGDIDGDGVLEIVVVDPATPTLVNIYNANDGSLDGTLDALADIEYMTLADLYNNDPNPEILIQIDGPWIVVIDYEGLSAAPGPASQRTGAHGLHPAYPNPSNSGTTLGFDTNSAGRVELTVYDVRGRVVRRIVEEDLEPGAHEFTWDGRSDAGHPLPSGQYFYSLTVDGTVVGTQKGIILK